MAPEFVKDGKKSPVVVHVRVNWILGCTDLDVTIFNRGKPSISMGHYIFHGYVSHNQRNQMVDHRNSGNVPIKNGDFHSFLYVITRW
jgi:hypothetical protein